MTLSNDGYAKPTDVVSIRVFTEPIVDVDQGEDSVQWYIDGIDADGNYTEDAWRFDSEDEAIKAIEEFRISAGIHESATVSFVRDKG